MMTQFPISTMKKLMKKAGVDRASDEAASELSDALTELAFDISRKALGFMYHAKRKTITEEDIRLAASD